MEFERVKNVIVDQLSVDADEVTLEASFVDDLGADSLDVVELIMKRSAQYATQLNILRVMRKIRSRALYQYSWCKA